MAILYTPTKYAFFTEGLSLTEQEHQDSCDINKMIKSASRGLTIRGGKEPIYGHDDLTLDGLQFRIQKQNLEEELKNTSEALEFTQHELDQIPESVRKKYKFRKKEQTMDEQPAKKPNEQNDPKKAANNVPTPAPTPEPPKP